MLPVCGKIAQFVNFESEMYKSASINMLQPAVNK